MWTCKKEAGFLVFLIIGVLPLLLPHAAQAEGKPVEIKVEWYDPNGRYDIPLICFEVMKQDPSIVCQPFSPLAVQGGLGYDSGKIMALATDTGPDVFNLEIFQIASFIDQGFLVPLDEFVGYDKNGDGVVDDSEALWPEWKNLSPLWRKIATYKGHVYCIPARYSSNLGVIVRRDLLREEGIDPNKPPRDWEEFYRWMQKLTWPHKRIMGAPVQRGQFGFYYHGYPSYVWPWLWTAGGDLVLERKTNPKTGKTRWYPKEEIEFKDPETGESLAGQPSVWKATLDTPEMRATLEFLWRCFHQPWVRDLSDNSCMDLSAEDVARGEVRRPDGKTFRFKPEEIIRGVAWSDPASVPTYQTDLLNRGETAAIMTSIGSQEIMGNRVRLNSSQVGFWAIPPRELNGKAIVYFENHWLGFSSQLAGDSNRQKREKAWKIISAIGGPLGKKIYTQYMVEQGWARFMPPRDLIDAGLGEYVDAVPKEWQREYDTVLKNSRMSPWNPNWLSVGRALLGNIVINLAADPAFDWRAALTAADHQANTRVMVKRSDVELDRYRPWAWGALGLCLAGVFGVFFWSQRRAKIQQASSPSAGSLRGVQRSWLPWIFLAPALISVVLWAYYPLARGTLMAFKDYRIMGESRWVGVDNFIAMFLDADFYRYVWATLRYLGYNMVLGFLMPLFLALLLNEVPRCKQLFRTFYFLPQLSSAVVLMLLWKEIYAPNEWGALNQVVSTIAGIFGAKVGPQKWLLDPHWAMPAVVMTTIWAGVGVASLVYLAALKMVPDDLYEAADIDGAGVRQKLFTITLPMLYPLMVINFTGAFIGALQGMENIFVMTGGSGDTTVLSMAIWYEAFVYLKFGAATAMAWVMGAMVIGFTVWQLRILRKVEFRTAEDR